MSSPAASPRPRQEAPSRKRLARRACDSCRVRRIRCSEKPPCEGCVGSGIECTFNRQQTTRGPRGLRARTLLEIERKSRGDDQGQSNGGSGHVPEPVGLEATAHLIQLLDVYEERLFPIWPIIDVAEMRNALQSSADDNDPFYILASAVALATIAQLKLDIGWVPSVEHVATSRMGDSHGLLDSLRIAFFLHIYHENSKPGGTQSLVYLREAITHAQVLRLDRESTYSLLPDQDHQVSRRILWLLFITERGVALLHKLPIVLKPNTLFPWFTGTDSHVQVMSAFLRLVHLFWVFDQSGIFEILRNEDSHVPNMELVARNCLDILQQKLSSPSQDDWAPGNDIQRADIFVTRQWMRTVLWRAASRYGIAVPTSPVDIAEDFLSLVSQLPPSALESHGPTLEFKTYEIANSVIDAIASSHLGASFDHSTSVLHRLRSLLSSSRGGNSALLNLLNGKMEASIKLGILFEPDPFIDDNLPWQRSKNSQTEIQTSYLSLLEHNSPRISWPPLDFGYLIRSPSPLSRMLLESAPRPTCAIGSLTIQPTLCGVMVALFPANPTLQVVGLSRHFIPVLRSSTMAFPEPRDTGMVYHRLGRSGLHVSAISLGSWLTYGGYAEDETAFACMKKAYDLGINFFDTAENYTAGAAEIVMGKAIKHFKWKRSDLVISTKINWGAVNGEILINNHGLSRKHVIEGLEASLERLQLKYVDIVYAHRPDRLTPMEETVRAFNYVIEQGMALYWGTSEWSADEIAEAVGIARDLRMIAPIAEQPFYNMLVRDKVEGQYQRLYERTGLGLTTFSPIKMGLLSGKYNDVVNGEPPKDSRFGASKDNFANFMRDRMGTDDWAEEIDKVRRLKPIADKLGLSQSQLAIAWCLKNPNVSSVITGASKPEQIEETVQALKFLDKLTPEVMDEIDAVTKNKVVLDPARQS
ncbi:NADP-dependent oxidoreductase domain-containing protein [Stachybotrys elegans]|uniref:NADP-dependent oxidoreductase domain-containing protein n=1 Tax=Stachybotrys elegans TaxID=80388 RepID=A0A8K0SPN6_9HYPO|nr:NADP-dependent oxidoreductase domain-containing protein [Stachybotrys elegans]